MKKIVIDSSYIDEKRVAILDGNTLIGFEVENTHRYSEKGRIYAGRIHKLDDSLQAAFIEYKENEYGFLSFTEIPIYYFDLPEDIKRSSIESEKHLSLYTKFNISEVIKPNIKIYVQVIKEKRYNKNVTLTAYLKIPSRYCVLTPFSTDCVISPQITDENVISKLKDVMQKNFKLKDCGIIIRKYAEFADEKSITLDYKRLRDAWMQISSMKNEEVPKLLYSDADLCERFIRENYNDDFDSIIINDYSLYQDIKKYVRDSLHLKKVNIKHYNGKKTIFDQYKIEDQVLNLYKDKVELKNGGYILISTTETLTAIDVNSGRMNKEISIEETAYKANLEAIAEIARQIELRGIGGIIVIDFIDMNNFKYINQVEKSLYDEFKRYRSRVQISQISKFGLVAISRQRTKNNLIELNTTQCTQCNGSGRVINNECHANQIFRQIFNNLNFKKFTIYTQPSLTSYLLNDKRKKIIDLEVSYDISIRVEVSSDLSSGEYFKLITEEEVKDVNVSAENALSSPSLEASSNKNESNNHEANSPTQPLNAQPQKKRSWIANWLNTVCGL